MIVAGSPWPYKVCSIVLVQPNPNMSLQMSWLAGKTQQSIVFCKCLHKCVSLRHSGMTVTLLHTCTGQTWESGLWSYYAACSTGQHLPLCLPSLKRYSSTLLTTHMQILCQYYQLHMPIPELRQFLIGCAPLCRTLSVNQKYLISSLTSFSS